jgi:TonB family protein
MSIIVIKKVNSGIIEVIRILDNIHNSDSKSMVESNIKKTLTYKHRIEKLKAIKERIPIKLAKKENIILKNPVNKFIIKDKVRDDEHKEDNRDNNREAISTIDENIGKMVNNGRGTNENKVMEVKRDKSTGIEEEYSHYDRDYILNIIREKIEKVKFYPFLARENGIEGETKIKFIMRDDGSIDRIKIVKSSSYGILDKASIRIVYKAQPFPYIKGWIEIPLIYKLEE